MAGKLSPEDFIKSLELSPRLTIELIVVNENNEILLVKREKDPYVGYWHLPGGFLLKGESIQECFSRISSDELKKRLDYSRSSFEGIFENINGDPRGHILHYVTKSKVESLEVGQYFSKIPEKTIPYQTEILKKLGFR